MKLYKLTYVNGYSRYDCDRTSYIAAPSIDHVVHHFKTFSIQRNLNDAYIKKIEMISDHIEIMK